MLTRRFVQLLIGLGLYGAGVALVLRSGLGGNPWDVFHQGVAHHTGYSIGRVMVTVALAVLLLWVPIRQRPGIGTVANALLIGVFAEGVMQLIGPAQSWVSAWAMLIGSTLTIGVAIGVYIGAGLGPGPRDGLMTGIVARTGWPVKWVRTGIELIVLAIGWLLGGTVGIGTVVFAVTIGPIAHRTIPYFAIKETK